MAAASPRGSSWLYGPAPDLLLGCGGAYALLFLALLVVGPHLREGQPTLLFPLLALLAGTPHYGATLLRVYEQRRDRRAYVLFSLWATLAVAGVFVTGLWVPAVGIFLVTLYLSWSPWHYTGQNYGIAVMLLRRNGVRLEGSDKSWFYASFLLSYALVLVIMHSGDGGSGIPAGYDARVIRFHPLGVPASLSTLLVPALGLAYVTALAGTALRLLRRAPVRSLLPAALLVLTQVLWFSLPFALRYLGSSPVRVEALDWDFRTHYFMWIATGHFAQYLWVTSYYAQKSGRWQGYTVWYAKVLAAGAAVWTLPALLVGPLALGPLSIDLGLAALVAAAVNVHHFILDGAIWKLRGRIAEVLIRSHAESPVEARASLRGALLRRAVWVACALALLLNAFRVLEENTVAEANRRRDLASVQASLDRLGWFGLDPALGRLRLGNQLLGAGEVGVARQQFQRSLRLAPLPGAWDGLAQTYALRGEWQQAARTCEKGLEAFPDDPRLLAHAALAWRQAGDPARGLPFIERAAENSPANAEIRSELERVRAAASGVL